MLSSKIRFQQSFLFENNTWSLTLLFIGILLVFHICMGFHGLFVLLSAHPLCWHSQITLSDPSPLHQTSLPDSFRLSLEVSSLGSISNIFFQPWGDLCILKNTWALQLVVAWQCLFGLIHPVKAAAMKDDLVSTLRLLQIAPRWDLTSLSHPKRGCLCLHEPSAVSPLARQAYCHDVIPGKVRWVDI